MKKIVTIAFVSLIVLSAFSTLMLQANASLDYQLTTNPLCDTWPSWSPDGTQITYQAHADSWNRHIWVMNNDGSNKIQLTSGSVVDVYPVFSPDGTKIAFSKWGFRGDRCDLMIMNADGTDARRVTFSGVPGMIEGTFEEPQWSKDGTKLIFIYREGTTGNILSQWVGTINVDGSDLQVIGRGESPRFCYGDTRILFHTDWWLDGQERIALMNADGTNVQILTSGPNDVYPDMSSLTHRIIFGRNQNLYIMNEDGSDLKAMTSDGLNNYYPRWAPDEKWIAYSSKKAGAGHDDIWKMEAPVEVINASVDTDPDTLNLGSKGNWITAYVELPEGYAVANINVPTIMLNGTIPADASAPTCIGDYDSDGVADLMVKFDRAQLAQYILDHASLTGQFTTVALTVTGELDDGTPFRGSDTITVVVPMQKGRQGIYPK